MYKATYFDCIFTVNKSELDYAILFSCKEQSAKRRESRLELESIVSNIDCRSSADVGCSWSREFTESLVSHGFKF
jgi:hypothetical protein